MEELNRYGQGSDNQPRAADGWKLTHLTKPSGLYGANGMQFGPDRRLYIVQVFGSQVSAIDTNTGAVETISPSGGPIVGPDDLAFDSGGNMYATEVMSARVCARSANGQVRIIADNVTAANGITVYKDRIFMDEFRPGGSLYELFPDGRTPRLMASDLPLPNALSVGPDGQLYFPAVVAGEIWRMPLDGGRPQRFIAGLAAPTAVKFDPRGFLVTTQALNGEVARIDIQNGTKTTVGKVRRGTDNFAIAADGRVFVSHYVDGGVVEVLADGSERMLVAPGFLGPMGLSFGNDGLLYAADGLSIAAIDLNGTCQRVAILFDENYPGYVRGLAAGSEGTLCVTNSAGDLIAYRPETHEARTIASGLNEVYGLALGLNGNFFVAEGGEGRLLEITSGGDVKVRARSLGRPTGIAVAADGACYVSDARGGRVYKVGAAAEPVLDGLKEPHGLSLSGDNLFVLDVGNRNLIAVSLTDKRATTVAANLPVGAPIGVTPHILMGVPGLLPGPLSPFADLATGRDGAVYMSADGEGSILRLSAA
jgi:sugar lactone lactonase YvrE